MNDGHASIALAVGGSDSSGQAGIQADLRTFAAFGVHGMCALSALTVQDHASVVRTEVMSPDLLRLQLETMMKTFAVRVVKTGMLVSADHIGVVASVLESRPNVFLVVDPVLESTSGTRLLDALGEQALKEQLIPMATVVTPNLPEAKRLLSESVLDDPAEILLEFAQFVGKRSTIVLKGGHNPDPNQSCDRVRLPNGIQFNLDAPRIKTSASRGSGCTFSSAIAAELALGKPVDEAIREAKVFITGALQHGLVLRSGRGPVQQMWRNGAAREQKRD